MINIYRMNRNTFDKLVQLLEENLIFTSSGQKPQCAVRYQLATFIMWYGARGSDVLSMAKRMGIGLGTVFLYCRCVSHALWELGVKIIVWGGQDRKTATATYFIGISGLHDCVGIVDGSLIQLIEVPVEWGLAHFCRKKYPAVSYILLTVHEATKPPVGQCTAGMQPS